MRWSITVTAKEITPQQTNKTHGKRKNLTAKKEKTHGKR